MFRPRQLETDEPLLWSPGTGSTVWEVFCACIAGDLGAVQALVAKDSSLVRCQYAYRTPLYFAVRENRLDVAKFLLENGADPFYSFLDDGLIDICRDRGHHEMEQLLETKLAEIHNSSPRGEAVAAAIRERDLVKVGQLLDESRDLLHIGDRRSNQPIHWAAMTRQLDVIDELLKRGANINARRSDGARPIQLTNGDYYYRGWRDVPPEVSITPDEVLAHLRERCAEVDICTAAKIGDEEQVRELLDENPALANQVSDYVTYYPCSGSPLRNAAAGGHLSIVQLLLDRGADPNLREEGIAPRGHALYAAAANKHYDIARLLLEHGAYPNPEVESSADALTRAVSNGDKPMIELLCSYGAAQSVELLAYDGDVRTAAAIFAADPQLADDPEALANAAGEGHEAFVRLMLRYQPDLAQRVVFPSWLASAKTRELNELLFEHRMNPSQPDWLGITPLHHLARRGNVSQAEVFVEHGADLHARDEEICSTPLGWAAKFGQQPMVEFLLQQGAELNLPDDPPWATRLAWAARRGHHQIEDLLRSRGGR